MPGSWPPTLPSGATGPIGPQGPSGAQGSAGATGPQGPSGTFDVAGSDVRYVLTSSFNPYSASLNTFTASQTTTNASVATQLTSLSSYTGSNSLVTASFYAFSASINAFTASQNATNASQATTNSSVASQLGSLSAYTGSDSLFTASVNAFTASLNIFTASQNTTNTSVSTYLSNLNAYTASMNAFSASQNTFSASVNTYTASLTGIYDARYVFTSSFVSSVILGLLTGTLDNRYALSGTGGSTGGGTPSSSIYQIYYSGFKNSWTDATSTNTGTEAFPASGSGTCISGRLGANGNFAFLAPAEQVISSYQGVRFDMFCSGTQTLTLNISSASYAVQGQQSITVTGSTTGSNGWQTFYYLWSQMSTVPPSTAKFSYVIVGNGSTAQTQTSYIANVGLIQTGSSTGSGTTTATGSVPSVPNTLAQRDISGALYFSNPVAYADGSSVTVVNATGSQTNTNYFFNGAGSTQYNLPPVPATGAIQFTFAHYGTGAGQMYIVPSGSGVIYTSIQTSTLYSNAGMFCQTAGSSVSLVSVPGSVNWYATNMAGAWSDGSQWVNPSTPGSFLTLGGSWQLSGREPGTITCVNAGNYTLTLPGSGYFRNNGITYTIIKQYNQTNQIIIGVPSGVTVYYNNAGTLLTGSTSVKSATGANPQSITLTQVRANQWVVTAQTGVWTYA